MALSSSLGVVLFALLASRSFEEAVGAIAPSSDEVGGPRRALLRAFGDADRSGGNDLPDVALELNSSNFEVALRQSPARFAVVEFFAHWCPACRNYKRHYEKVARLFNGGNAVHPGIVVMAKVDCAEKANKKLCDRFSVTYYPMLLWGPPSTFASGSLGADQKRKEIEHVNDVLTAERLLKWINTRLNSSFSLEDEKYENESTLPHNTSDPKQVSRAIYDVEESTAKVLDIILEHKMIKPETQVSLIKFLQLIATHHPSKRCRSGSAEILVNFDDLWPLTSLSSNTKDLDTPQHENLLKNFQICGKEVPRGYWIFCRGSSKETRGFSCGLWVLLHSLSVRVRDEESHLAFNTICEFIHNFFLCEECHRHFYAMCSSVTAPFNGTRDLALWFWSTHNRVNERLMKTEKALGTTDPKFPKMVWPPKQLCPSCYRPPRRPDIGNLHTGWNKDEVFNFLVEYYGKTLVSSYRDDQDFRGGNGVTMSDDTAASTNAVAVPVGAALGIALASCAFGALACFWRTQQKNRKYSHQLHSLKNI